MRQVNCNYDFSRELESLGVALLSGESCNLGLRITTDICPDTAPLVEEFMAVTLRQSGMNGWSKDPTGKWQAGRSASWDYDAKERREGWEAHDGYCIHLPRSLMEDLFIFLTLKLRPVEAVIRIEPLKGRQYEGVVFDSSFILFEPGEYRPFMNNVHRLASALEEEGTEALDYIGGLTHKYLAYWCHKEVLGYRVYLGEYAHTNRHAWSGRKLV